MGADGAYRYLLARRWARGPGVLFVMLNPSTADEVTDDPTIRRCVGFARKWRAPAMEVVNLYALRATHPRDLFAHRAPIGDDNDRAIRSAAARAREIVVAWGAHGERDPARVAHVIDLLGGRDMRCLGANRGGSPKHPLFVPYLTKRRRWTA
ncbi:MAG TPA: DUF1643 domain-containing protein [Kofleriaceae bacterium]|nr:DUF1643 domain-containing protein [Kofleriaceae bacterium]